jgi:hypothetical protein
MKGTKFLSVLSAFIFSVCEIQSKKSTRSSVEGV